jgi:hypothetical protein
MTRNENDLRDALRELEQLADRRGAPSTASLLTAASDDRPGELRDSASRRFPRWLPPLAAAAAVAAAALAAVTLSSGRGSSSHPADQRAGGQRHRTVGTSHHSVVKANPTTSAATILDDAAATLDSAPAWTTPAPQDFFYVRTTDATTWTSVSGSREGDGRTANGAKIWVPGCSGGQIVSGGESGTCTLSDVPHYLGDAPTDPAAWDAYLEHMAPGAKAADAQGKIIVQVLHQDLIAPKAAAALLRYTESCPGLHTLTVRPVAGEALTGVTCASMTNGSYGLVFDATSHALVGFVVVTGNGQQDGAAEIIQQTGVVPAIGRRP